MREVVMSSDEVDETAEEITTAHGDGRRPDGLMRWEKFLPKIALRVLLVESDDSTSQIVAALLRKCNYKVAAVSDGLKAWEIIKGRPHNIDLILTEVYLPSISGYALLTLIMEHEICKNIPVIMMSSQDSVSTVYKCMLKGAADYLVKPLRKNELRNLWQHVWRRRQSLRANANSPQEESAGQQKLEAASENNSTSNQASGIKRDEDQNEKGSEAESSCAKQDMEVESGDMENLQSLLEKKDGMRGTVDNVNPRIVNDDVEPDRQMDSARNISRKAFDFMGAFRSDRRVTDHETSTIKSALGLDLSLRRCNHISNPYPSSGEKSNFRSSSASAFTRYVNRPIQTECSLSPNTSNVNREVGFQQNAGSSETARYSNSKAPVPPNIQSSETPWRNKSSVCNSIPAKDIRFENNKTPIAVNCSSIFITQSSPSTTPSRCSSSPHEPSSSLHPFQPPVLEKGESGRLHNQLDGKRDHKPDTLYDKQNVTITADGFSNGIRFASTSGRSNISNVDHLQVPATGTNAENKTEHGVLSPSGGGKSQRSIQREAALAKFRMKRKDRCFEKKVRYESRKKLAEQRPRVKGQFVRQVNTEHVSAAEEEAETPTATLQNFA